MSRGGVLLAVALTLALSPAAAAGETALKPDLMIVGRGGNTSTGADVYGDGTGQQRSIVVDTCSIAVLLRLENEGSEQATFTITGTHATSGWSINYSTDYKRDIVHPPQAPPFEDSRFALRVPPHRTKAIVVVVDSPVGLPLGSTQTVIVRALSQEAVDAVTLKFTNVTRPGIDTITDGCLLGA